MVRPSLFRRDLAASALSFAFGAAALIAACGTDPASAPATPSSDAGTVRRDAGAGYPDNLAPHDGGAASDASGTTDARDSDDADAMPGDAASRCAATTSCPAALRDLGAASGDKVGAPVTATGVGNTWLKIWMTEDDSSVISAVDLKLRVTLTSPPLENYDVVIYLASTSQLAAVECQTVRAQSTSISQTDQLAVSWPDNHPTGGQDDSKNVTIEVRHASGPCAPGAAWSLRVEGGTL